MTFSKIGNEKCGSPFQRMIPPDKGSAETGCRFCRYRPSDGLLFSWTITTARTVFQIKNAIWRESCPPKNRMGVCGFDFPVIHPPPSAKGWSDFRLHNRGVFLPILGLPDATADDHESICFIEHPRQAHARTPSDLRAGNPTHHKSSPTHPRASASPFPRRLRTQ